MEQIIEYWGLMTSSLDRPSPNDCSHANLSVRPAAAAAGSGASAASHAFFAGGRCASAQYTSRAPSADHAAHPKVDAAPCTLPCVLDVSTTPTRPSGPQSSTEPGEKWAATAPSAESRTSTTSPPSGAAAERAGEEAGAARPYAREGGQFYS